MGSASNCPDLAIPKSRPHALCVEDARAEQAAYAAQQRKIARERDGYQDRVTGRRLSILAVSLTDRLELHHIVPRSAGGTSDASNLLSASTLTHKRFTCHELDVELPADANGPVVIVERKTGKRYLAVPGKKAQEIR